MSVSTPWLAGGPWDVSQGWGPTDFGAEPAGHGVAHWHSGIDLTGAGILGDFITAPVAGTVRDVVNQGGFGNELVFSPAGQPGVEYILGHLSSFGAAGPVQAGDVIGRVGSTGNSTGPHLHFQENVMQGGSWVDVNPQDALARPSGIQSGPGTPQQMGPGSAGTPSATTTGLNVGGVDLPSFDPFSWASGVFSILGGAAGKAAGDVAGGIAGGIVEGIAGVFTGIYQKTIAPWFGANVIPIAAGIGIFLIIAGGSKHLVEDVRVTGGGVANRLRGGDDGDGDGGDGGEGDGGREGAAEASPAEAAAV